jgi:outer membrane protein TolC
LVSLEEALSLAGADNPTIGLAQEAIQASLAERMQARALLFPTATMGFNFRVHQGNLLASPGIIRYVSSESLYAGFGANAKAAETVGIPGVRILAQLSEAAFAPRIARLRVQGRILDSAAVRNQVLLDVAERYYDLAGAEARILAMRRSEAEMAEVVRVTSEFARLGQGKQADADRALSESLLLHTEAQRLDEEAAVASAQLARLLGTDPDNRLHADAEAAAPISLVSENDDLSRLIQEALGSRPEVASAAAAIREAETRLRQERVRPMLPLISVGFSLGTFGGGSDLAGYRFDRFDGRMDFDVLAVWSLQNLGFGNRALRHQARSEINRAFAEQNLVIDNVRREVAEAYALIADRRRELEVFRRQVQTAQNGFERELLRTKNAAGLPIEVLKSLNQLTAARQSYIQAAIEYNQAQFRLFVALGQPPSAITD